MPVTWKHAPLEREHTDRSLRDERCKTDDELAKRRLDLEEDADTVVSAARARADEVLSRARANADQRLELDGADTDERVRVEDERRREDEVLREERATADAALLDEREARRRAVMALLALERGHTDEGLLLERSRVDDMIASRDDFLAIVSHDLRNVLGGIVMSSAALKRVEADARVRDGIDREARRIERNAARMARLVGDLLDVVSIEAGRFAVAPERHDAMDLLREALDVFRPLARAENISMASNARAGSLLGRYDHERILQVLANLVGNAIKFTGEGGRIELHVEAIGDHLSFAVRDNGVGIDADKLERIFERFWQVTQQHRSGLGLGLYISKCIVEAHGGRIWAESQPGLGSSFYFTLPAAA